MKILSVVGARPNFMKIAPIIRAIKKFSGVKNVLVHTGQHYDEKMSDAFFRDLGIPRPDVNLGVGSGSHAQQTAQVISLFEPIVLKEKPDVVLVVGDVNSTMGCSIVAAKLRVPVVHVEAGLRSFDRAMPEEINRLVTDSIADILFTTSEDADDNLINEGIPKNRIFFVGNVMIDNLLFNVPKSKKSSILLDLRLNEGNYALLTLHRPSNVDSKDILRKIFGALKMIQKDIKVVFPVHPRTLKNLEQYFSSSELKAMKNLILTEPLGYLDFLKLMMNAKFVMTDSGGVQEETTVLKVPCLTLRENTERPVTVSVGSNILIGFNMKKLVAETSKIMAGKGKKGRTPKFWDGKSSERIIQKLTELYKQGRLLR